MYLQYDEHKTVMAILLIATIGIACTFGLIGVGAYSYGAKQAFKGNMTTQDTPANINKDITKSPVITPFKTGGGGGMNQTQDSKSKRPKRTGNWSMGE